MTQFNKYTFDPSKYLIEIKAANQDGTTEIHYRLPVAAQITWFRMEHPSGKIQTEMKNVGNGGYICKAKIYLECKDGPEEYVAEATAFRCYDPCLPGISPLSWAQTAAIGAALAYAGYGCQYQLDGNLAGEQPLTDTANERGDWNIFNAPTPTDSPYQPQPQPTGNTAFGVFAPNEGATTGAVTGGDVSDGEQMVARGEDERYQAACCMISTLPKHQGQSVTLGQLAERDPDCIQWLAEQNKGALGEAARFMLEYAAKHVTG